MRRHLLMAAATLPLLACQPSEEAPATAGADSAAPGPSAAPALSGSPASRQPFYGDLHVHTAYSFDAFAMGTLASPMTPTTLPRGAS